MAKTAQASFLDTPALYNVRHRAMITVSAIGATLLQSLDQTIANVALPYMQGSFSASYDEITWVLTSYIAAATESVFPFRLGGFAVLSTGIGALQLMLDRGQDLDWFSAREIAFEGTSTLAEAPGRLSRFDGRARFMALRGIGNFATIMASGPLGEPGRSAELSSAVGCF